MRFGNWEKKHENRHLAFPLLYNSKGIEIGRKVGDMKTEKSEKDSKSENGSDFNFDCTNRG